VKHARVEDHDDLLPIVAAAAAGPWPSLAALPQSCEPAQPYALTRLISSQDSQNLVLVAEDEGRTVSLKNPYKPSMPTATASCGLGLGSKLMQLQTHQTSEIISA
jgi:hypothetical protein